MQRFEQGHPLPVAIHLLSTALIAMFCRDPLLLGLSLCSALGCYWLQRLDHRLHRWALLLFFGFTLLTPLWNQRGSTVLFVLNDRPVTLEAVCYGAVSALMLLAVLYWFALFSHWMTTDRLLYLFRRLSPKLALTVSMGLRQASLLSAQLRQIREAQTVMGLQQEQNLIDRVRSELRSLSAVLSWGLENGIVTADSMSARGYGTQRRSSFSLFVFHRKDALHLLIVIVLTASVLLSITKGVLLDTYYPAIQLPAWNGYSWICYCAYGLLSCYPLLQNGKETLQWRYLQSKI